MSRKTIIFILHSLLLLLLLAFEKTIGIPVVSLLIFLRISTSLYGVKKLVFLGAVSFAISAAFASLMSVTLAVFMLLQLVSEKYVVKNILHQLALVSLGMTVILMTSAVQLFPLSFIYLGAVWFVVLWYTFSKQSK